MTDSSSKTTWPDAALETAARSQGEPILMQDRHVPLWVALFSSFFTFGAGLCYVAIAVFALLIHDMVAIKGMEPLASILGVSAIAPIFGLLIFDASFAKAFAGQEDVRRRNGALGYLLVAVLCVGGLGFLHPLLSIAPAFGALICWGLIGILAPRMRKEKAWDFQPKEAAAFLAGRDKRALDLARQPRYENPLIGALLTSTRLATLIASVAVASWLSLQDVMNQAAIAAAGLISTGCVEAAVRYLKQRSILDPEHIDRAASVTLLRPENMEEFDQDHGLVVAGLSARMTNDRTLLNSLSFTVPNGQILGLSGDNFAGKSLLMQALSAPQDLCELHVSGHVVLNGNPLWGSVPNARSVDMVHVSQRPIILRGCGRDNLCCYGQVSDHRAEQLLRSLVYNGDTVDHILNAKDASQLSSSEQKALVLARAFLMRPDLYLFDRPEDQLPESYRSSFITRLKEEKRRGAICLVVTEDRAILETCDQLMMMQGGRLLELASAADIRARLSSGWHRFVTKRELDSEEALDSWIASKFRRDGDEVNQRNVCMAANELLSHGCRPENGQATTDQLCFEMKLFQGYCLLRLQQSQPLSSGAVERATLESQSAAPLSQSPLARMIGAAETVENIEAAGSMWLQLRIGIYDPRKESPPSLGDRKAKDASDRQ